MTSGAVHRLPLGTQATLYTSSGSHSLYLDWLFGGFRDCGLLDVSEMYMLPFGPNVLWVMGLGNWVRSALSPFQELFAVWRVFPREKENGCSVTEKLPIHESCTTFKINSLNSLPPWSLSAQKGTSINPSKASTVAVTSPQRDEKSSSSEKGIGSFAQKTLLSLSNLRPTPHSRHPSSSLFPL
ncbi:hypothetical protein JTE90_001948 [Oedothorax gibbosus]|uniref:Uncharacterized protein n=1 Tax=Oedothorax gibbosus TaxID=931172 RepID=A0AAV6VU85_9ARAC|nr:hypothetical protein JTE90_001948 [Oedothorax gibbosus]